MQELKIGRVYRHFKGDHYVVEGMAMAGCGSDRWRCS